MKIATAISLAAVFAFVNCSAANAVRVMSPDAHNGIELTIYNQNFGVVKDQRTFYIKQGMNSIRLANVAARIDPTSVSLRSLSHPNSFVIREQNYEYDLLNPESILKRSVGQQVKFIEHLPGGGIREVTGELMNPPQVTVVDTNGNVSEQQQQLVVKTADGFVLNPQGEVQISNLPTGLVSIPSLLWKLESNVDGDQNVELGYQTAGLNWKCDYVAVLDKDDANVDLNSWVTLDNQSGTSYVNAGLKLMAGDVHRVTAQVPAQDMEELVPQSAAAAEPQFKEAAFAEYHLYSLQNKTDVLNNQTKQLSLFNADAVPAKKLFIFDGGQDWYYGGNGNQNKKVNVKFELANSQANHLGMPMPKGKVRVYKRDNDGALQFVGEDEIDHTPKDEKIRLYIGDAFDLVGEQKQISRINVSRNVTRASYEVSLRNHKPQPVTITTVEHAGGDWKITASNQPYTKKDSTTFEFSTLVPANSSKTVTYTVEWHY